MAKRFTIQMLSELAKKIGGSSHKWTGTRTNINFLGTGPTTNPLFQGPLRGLESATLGNIGRREEIVRAVNDAMGYVSSGKLNSIQTEILGRNFEGINKILNPPVLPTITDMATRTRNLDIRDLRALRSGVDPKAPGYIRQGDPITAENFGASQFAPSEASLKARAMAAVDIPQKTASARATMIRLLDMEAGQGGQTLREIMSPTDLKFLLEGGGGVKGDPIALFAKYFGNASARQIPSAGTPEVIEEFATQVIRRKDRLGRGINDPFFRPEEIDFAGGGLAEILQVPRSAYSKGRAVKSLMGLVNKKFGKGTLKKASDLPKGTKYEELEAVKAFEQRNPWGYTEETKRINKILRKFDIRPSQALDEQKTIAKKYGDLLDDDLLRNLLYDMDPQHQAEVMATLDEMLIMQNVKGMGPDEIIAATKASWGRKPSASGGLARILEV